MSYNFDNLNKKSTVMKDVNTDGMEFKPLKDFCGQDIAVKGFFFTEGRYGRQVVVVTSDCLVNMPGRAVEYFMLIKSTPEALDAMLEGKLKITGIKEMENKNGKFIAFDYANA